MKHFAFYLLFVVTITFSIANAQSKNQFLADSIAKKLDWYSSIKNEGILFAHFDKTIYTNNEFVWFTAYLLNGKIRNDGFINVILVNNFSRTIALQKKFLCEAGLSFGKIELPDTLSAGNYSFIIYSSDIRAGKPKYVFTQPIVIKNTLSGSIKPGAQFGSSSLKDRKQTFPVGKQTDGKQNLSTNKLAVTLANAVVDDTLRVDIQTKQPIAAYMVVHNYKQLFFMLPIKISSLRKAFKIALTDLPKGIAEIILLDSLNTPITKKLFFAHYNQRNNLQIITDKRSYNTREKVSLQLKLSKPDGSAASGYVSIACVQANRQPLDKKRDIESFVYLNHELDVLPVGETYNGNYMEKIELEKILLTKNWRNYNWNDLQKTTSADTIVRNDSLVFTGKVTHYGKPLKKPVHVFLLKDSTTVLQTDFNGKFILSRKDLTTSDNKKIHLLVGGSHPGDYEITVLNPYENINNALAKNNEIMMSDPLVPFADKSGSSNYLNGFDHILSLKEVKIEGKKDNSFYGKTANSCGDYVCKYGFLNCPQHGGDPQNVAAVNGKTYKYFDGISADGSEIFHSVFYQSCNPPKYGYTKSIDGIKIPAAFYPVNYEKESSAVPEYVSTIYWNHLYKISPDGSIPIQFCTSDITGDFKIVVQGVTGNDVVYGEKEIKVNANIK